MTTRQFIRDAFADPHRALMAIPSGVVRTVALTGCALFWAGVTIGACSFL